MEVISRGKWFQGLTWMPRSRRRSSHQFAADDAEIEPELVPHLLLPLDLERRRADDQDLPGTVPDDQFEGDHPRLDGLAQAHVVSNQQVDPRHLDRPDHRVKLVILDVDARAERGLDVADIRQGRRSPADGIEEGVELVGRVEPGRVGQGDLLDEPGTGLQLPDDLDLLTESVVFDGCQGDKGLRVGDDLQTAGRQRAGDNLVDDPVPGSNADQLPLLGSTDKSAGHFLAPPNGVVGDASRCSC